MQFQIGAKYQNPTAVSAAGNDDSATTMTLAGVNGGLNGSGIIMKTIADGTKLQNVIFHTCLPYNRLFLENIVTQKRNIIKINIALKYNVIARIFCDAV